VVKENDDVKTMKIIDVSFVPLTGEHK